MHSATDALLSQSADASSLNPAGLRCTWARGNGRAWRIPPDDLRGFSDGAFATARAWGDARYVVIDTRTVAPADVKPPWQAPEAAQFEAALRKTYGPIDGHRIAAVSADGRLVAAFLARGAYEQQDPDAGSVLLYNSVDLGLWDAALQTWRWETDRTPSSPTMGTILWMMGAANLFFTFDEGGLGVRARDHEEDEVYDIESGKLRRKRPSDLRPVPSALAGDRTVKVLAADAASRLALCARGAVAECWQLDGAQPLGSVDLTPMSDRPSAATLLGSQGSFLLGTESGRLMRFDPL